MTTNTIDGIQFPVDSQNLPETQEDQGGKNLNELYQQINNAQSSLKLISERLMQSESCYEESQAVAGVQLQLSAIADQLEQEIHRVEKDNGSG